MAKYPHIEDYRKAVRELDEKEYLSMWLVMCEIRNRYCTLHDIVMKNIEKLKKPRSCNTQSLYWTSSSFPFRDVPFRDKHKTSSSYIHSGGDFSAKLQFPSGLITDQLEERGKEKYSYVSLDIQYISDFVLLFYQYVNINFSLSCFKNILRINIESKVFIIYQLL